MCASKLRLSWFAAMVIGPFPSVTPASCWPSPEPSWFGLSLSTSSPLLSSFFPIPARSFRLGHYLPGFLPSSRHESGASTSRELPRPATFRPQAFTASRRFAPSPTAVGLFHPTTTSRVMSCPGVFPSPQRRALVGFGCPLVVVPRCPDNRGLPPDSAGLDLEALFRVKIRRSDTKYRGPIPSSVFISLRVLPPPTVSPVPRAIRP